MPSGKISEETFSVWNDKKSEIWSSILTLWVYSSTRNQVGRRLLSPFDILARCQQTDSRLYFMNVDFAFLCFLKTLIKYHPLCMISVTSLHELNFLCPWIFFMSFLKAFQRCYWKSRLSFYVLLFTNPAYICIHVCSYFKSSFIYIQERISLWKYVFYIAWKIFFHDVYFFS